MGCWRESGPERRGGLKGNTERDNAMESWICLIFEKMSSTGHAVDLCLVLKYHHSPLQKPGIDPSGLCPPHPHPLAQERPTILLDVRLPRHWQTGSCSHPCFSPEESCYQPIGKLHSQETRVACPRILYYSKHDLSWIH